MDILTFTGSVFANPSEVCVFEISFILKAISEHAVHRDMGNPNKTTTNQYTI